MATYYAQNGGLTTKPDARAHSDSPTTVMFSMTPVNFQIGDVVVLCLFDVTNKDGVNSYGLWLQQVVIEFPGWDSGTAIAFNVGDQTSATTFLTGVQLGRSATAGVINSADTSAAASGTTSGSLGRGVCPKKYTDTNDIRLTFTAAAGTLVTTTPLKGYVLYSLEEAI